MNQFWFMKLLAWMWLKLTQKTFIPMEMKCWLWSVTYFRFFHFKFFAKLQLQIDFFNNHFVCLQFSEFSCVNCRVSRRTFLGNRQNIPKNAKKAKTGGRQSKIWAPTENITLVVLPNDLEHFAKDKCYSK